MNRDSPNPYRDMPLRELHQVMNQRAGELLGGANVSRRDLAYLLIAAAWPLATGEGSVGSPAQRVLSGTAVDEAFWTDYESALRALMHNTYCHAQEAAGLTHEDVHRFTAVMRERGTPIVWGTDSEDQFRRSLQLLQAAKDLKARDWIA